MAIYITKGSFRTTFREHMVFILYGHKKSQVHSMAFAPFFSYHDVSQKVSSSSHIKLTSAILFISKYTPNIPQLCVDYEKIIIK